MATLSEQNDRLLRENAFLKLKIALSGGKVYGTPHPDSLRAIIEKSRNNPSSIMAQIMNGRMEIRDGESC